MRENSVKEVAIGLSFASDWSREKEREGERRNFCWWIAETYNEKPIQSRINIIFAYSWSIE